MSCAQYISRQGGAQEEFSISCCFAFGQAGDNESCKQAHAIIGSFPNVQYGGVVGLWMSQQWDESWCASEVIQGSEEGMGRYNKSREERKSGRWSLGDYLSKILKKDLDEFIFLCIQAGMDIDPDVSVFVVRFRLWH